MDELDLIEWYKWVRFKKDIHDISSLTKKILLNGWMAHGVVCIFVGAVKGVINV